MISLAGDGSGIYKFFKVIVHSCITIKYGFLHLYTVKVGGDINP